MYNLDTDIQHPCPRKTSCGCVGETMGRRIFKGMICGYDLHVLSYYVHPSASINPRQTLSFRGPPSAWLQGVGLSAAPYSLTHIDAGHDPQMPRFQSTGRWTYIRTRSVSNASSTIPFAAAVSRVWRSAPWSITSLEVAIFFSLMSHVTQWRLPGRRL